MVAARRPSRASAKSGWLMSSKAGVRRAGTNLVRVVALRLWPSQFVPATRITNERPAAVLCCAADKSTSAMRGERPYGRLCSACS